MCEATSSREQTTACASSAPRGQRVRDCPPMRAADGQLLTTSPLPRQAPSRAPSSFPTPYTMQSSMGLSYRQIILTVSRRLAPLQRLLLPLPTALPALPSKTSKVTSPRPPRPWLSSVAPGTARTGRGATSRSVVGTSSPVWGRLMACRVVGVIEGGGVGGTEELAGCAARAMLPFFRSRYLSRGPFLPRIYDKLCLSSRSFARHRSACVVTSKRTAKAWLHLLALFSSLRTLPPHSKEESLLRRVSRLASRSWSLLSLSLSTCYATLRMKTLPLLLPWS